MVANVHLSLIKSVSFHIQHTEVHRQIIGYAAIYILRHTHTNSKNIIFSGRIYIIFYRLGYFFQTRLNHSKHWKWMIKSNLLHDVERNWVLDLSEMKCSISMTQHFARGASSFEHFQHIISLFPWPIHDGFHVLHPYIIQAWACTLPYTYMLSYTAGTWKHFVPFSQLPHPLFYKWVFWLRVLFIGFFKNTPLSHLFFLSPAAKGLPLFTQLLLSPFKSQ